jgi:ribosome-associated protein
MDRTHQPVADDATLEPSKSQRKREMHALQDVGEQLVELSAERLAKMNLPDPLREAVREAQRITKHGGRRRQMQYIGRLMRGIDAEPIREALAAIEGRSALETARQHRLERLRLRLLEDEAVLSEIARAHPGADLQHLRQLRRNTLKEREQARPPRSFRELFRVLRELDAGGSQATQDEKAEA